MIFSLTRKSSKSEARLGQISFPEKALKLEKALTAFNEFLPLEEKQRQSARQLGLDQIDAHRLGHVLVLPQCHPLTPEACIPQPPGDKEGNTAAGQDQVVEVLRPDQSQTTNRHIGDQ